MNRAAWVAQYRRYREGKTVGPHGVYLLILITRNKRRDPLLRSLAWRLENYRWKKYVTHDLPF